MQLLMLRVNDGHALPALIDAGGIHRIDKAYQDALRAGTLRTEPPKPEVSVEETGEEAPLETSDTPQITSGESVIRAVPGVTSASTTSLALGGVSLIRITYEGGQAVLRAALEMRGWHVQEAVGVLRVRRGGAPLPSQPIPPAEAGNSSDG